MRGCVQMIHREYLVLGAGIAGASACEAIRQHDKKGSLTMVGAEEFEPYQRPLLSKDFLKEARGVLELVRYRNGEWYEKHGVEMRLNTVVREMDLDRRRVVLGEGQVVEFRKACVALGSRPRKPAVAGNSLGNVFYLRSLRDGLALREAMLTGGEVVVVGGGLLGVEAAASLKELGKKVTLIDRRRFLWQNWLDDETAQWLTEFFAEKKVNLLMQEELSGLEGKTTLKNVAIKSGKRFPASLALVAIGVVPNTELVANTPLSGPYGVPVDEFLETEERGIFAAGDLAVLHDPVFGGLRRYEHWESAKEQGLVAGANMADKKRVRFEFLPAFWTAFFDVRLDLLGDFRQLPVRVEREGEYGRKKFVLRYYNAEGRVAVVLCNATLARLQQERAELVRELGKVLAA